MRQWAIELHPSAVAEAQAAYQWYSARSEATGVAFQAELDRAIEALSHSPFRWPNHFEGTRRYPLRRFPFYIVY